MKSWPEQLRSFRLPHAGSIVAMLLWAIVLAAVFSGGAYRWYLVQNELAQSQGLIGLSDIRLDKQANAIRLQASAQVKLPSSIRAGLHSGVPLTFVLNLRLLEARRWLPDKTVLDFERQYKLTYYELTRHYRVHAVDVDVSRNYRSLSSALEGLGQLGSILFTLEPDQRQQIEQTALVGSLEMSLSKSALPLPLQPIFRSSWTLISEEYRWSVT